ncbi:hypothetical protein ACFPRL_34950 [Pseudoclavibacter helvolus]
MSYETLGSPSRKRRASSFKPLPYASPRCQRKLEARPARPRAWLRCAPDRASRRCCLRPSPPRESPRECAQQHEPATTL